MALRLRRGTDAERLLITPVQGELIYTTDTKKLYIGDGTTVGGRIVEGAGSPDLAGLTDINVAGAEDGQLLAYNSATLKWEASDLTGVVQGSNYQINITGSDSSTIVNAETLTITANVVNGELFGDSNGTHTGDVLGTLFGGSIGIHTGDVQGSVFSDDSTLIIDGINNTVNAVSVTTDNLTTDRITNPTGSLSVSTDSIVKPNLTVDVVSLDNVSTIALTRTSAADISGDPAIYGRLVFTRNDLNGSFTSSLVSGARDYIALFNDPAGNNADPSKYLLLTNGKLSMGAGSSPSATLEVAGSIKPGVYADATARDAAISSPTAGEMVFVTDVAKFQGYDGSTWANLN